ncbi:MAG: dicarboxylate/amino acid:cation symporter [Arenimonas sp.]|nr:dicarboxylate/amino acid:cation symporter [Arenimonas sp.]
MTSSTRVFFGLILGAVSGILLSKFLPDVVPQATAIAQPIGRLWLNALQMTIVPLVVSLLIVGINQTSDVSESGRVARRAIIWILFFLLFSGALAALMAPAMLNWLPHDPQLMQTLQQLASASPTAMPAANTADWTTGFIPSNVFSAAVQTAIVPLVAFTLLFAFALTQIESERRKQLVSFFQGIADTMIVMVGWVLWIGPLGVFGLIFPISAQAGAGLLSALGFYVVMLSVLYITITLLMYVFACVGKGEPLKRFASAILPAQVVSMSTQSSLASLPAMVESSRVLNYPTQVSGLILPMAVSIYRITSPMQYLGVVSFIAWSYGIDLSVTQVATAVLLSVVISMGSVGLPGQAGFMGTNLPIVQSTGLPIEPLGILLAVDIIPDIFATLGNVTADLTVTSKVARSEMGDVSS